MSRYHAVNVENAACGWTPLRVSRSSGGAVGRPLDYRFVGLRQIWQNRFNVCPLLGTRLVWGFVCFYSLGVFCVFVTLSTIDWVVSHRSSMAW